MALDLLLLYVSQQSVIWNVFLALMLSFPLLFAIHQLLHKTSAAAASSASFSPAVPPGTLGLPVIGENVALMRSFNEPLGIYDFVSRRYRRYGNPFKTNVLGSISVFVGNRDAAKFIFANEDKLFRLSTSKSMADVIGKHSLFEATGEAHRKLRRVMGEPLSMDSLRKHFRGMQDIAMDVLRKWKEKGSLCVLSETNDYAFQIISYILVSSKPGDEQEKMKSCFQKIIDALVALPINMPGFAYYKGLQGKRELNSMLSNIILRRKENQEKKDDFLQSIIDNQVKGIDYVLFTEEIIDNLIAILFAGHETVSTALMWAIKFIEDNSNVRDKLVMEHIHLTKSRGSNDHLTWEEINGMVYTNKFINEVLRVANIARLLPRQALQDVEINGYIVKKGWKVIVDTQAPHFDERYFQNSCTIEPSHFNEAPKPNTFMPFGGGARMCLGMNLAKLEMAIFIHYLMISYRWQSLSNNCSLAPTLIPRLKNGYPIKVELV